MLTSHPAYGLLVDRYRAARAAWRASPVIQDAARAMQMSEREYCDRFLAHNFGSIVYAGNQTTLDLTQEHFALAFQEAGP